jgi:hypothetical protein
MNGGISVLSIKLLFVGLLTAVALSGVAAATAAASEFFVEKEAVKTAVATEGSSGATKLEATGVAIECLKDTNTGKLEESGKSKLEVKAKECTVKSPASCTVKEPIELKTAGSLVSEPVKDELKPSEGTTIAEITITGEKCTVAGKYKLTGSQTCELPKVEEEAAEHEIVCKTTGSKLELGGKAATLETTEKVKTVGGKKWSAKRTPPGRPEWVDFENNQPVLIDHTKNTKHGEKEAAVNIEQVGAKRSVEWESPKAGEVVKNWPLAFVTKTTIKLSTRIALEKVTAEFLEKNIEGNTVITGETAIGGVSIKFTKELTLEEIKKQLGEDKTFLTASKFETSAPLGEKVVKSLATITWKWSFKEIGQANSTEQELGKSTHTFYSLYKNPLATIYFTILDLATINIQAQAEPFGEEKVIAGAWAGFATKEKEGEAGRCTVLECPTIHIRTYEPKTGTITRTGTTVLWYYEEVKLATLEEYILKKLGSAQCAFVQTTAALLESLSGECSSWQDAFKNTLAIEGLSSTALEIVVKFPKGEGKPCEVAAVCYFLVKNWEFIGKGSSGDPLFPYTWAEVEDENGLAGQGIENPQSYFLNHQIIEVGNNLYDPSYGTAPIGNGKPEEKAANLLKYQEASISAFCNTKPNCQSPGVGTLKLEAK